jgi:hypothetical protein
MALPQDLSILCLADEVTAWRVKELLPVPCRFDVAGSFAEVEQMLSEKSYLFVLLGEQANGQSWFDLLCRIEPETARSMAYLLLSNENQGVDLLADGPDSQRLAILNVSVAELNPYWLIHSLETVLTLQQAYTALHHITCQTNGIVIVRMEI